MTQETISFEIENGSFQEIHNLPLLNFNEFKETLIHHHKNGKRLVALFAVPKKQHNLLIAIVANDSQKKLYFLQTQIEETYPSLTLAIPSAHLFEREIAEQWGIIPKGHPWLKPVRYHASYHKQGRDAWGRASSKPITPGVFDFFSIKNNQIHEVGVGPVHAGIIEPGHFRFQCDGEKVLFLETALGYQHRGIEKALKDGPNEKTLYYMQTLAGDTTIGHTLAYCHNIEALSDCKIPMRAEYLRGIALELERLANHTGDLGALSNDIGFLPTASYCGKLRGDYLNLTAELCGSRFGREMLNPGGVNFDVDDELIDIILTKLNKTYKLTIDACNLLWDRPSVMTRFEKTGILKNENAQELGIVGLAARASGLKRDVRSDYPLGVYQKKFYSPAHYFSGDVYARAFVRFLELQESYSYIKYLLNHLPQGPVIASIPSLKPNALSLSLVEGWRGEICHIAITDEKGSFEHYKVVDPSFHNWMGLAYVLRQEKIFNFPLCNKSFNLSYAGHDL
jgi:Ni,Fe-hydrogenase III large subunit/Ni,Fe-hydrogenase III component G